MRTFYQTVRPNNCVQIYEMDPDLVKAGAWEMGERSRKMPLTTPEEYFQADVFA
jgi:hypothetical protein